MHWIFKSSASLWISLVENTDILHPLNHGSSHISSASLKFAAETRESKTSRFILSCLCTSNETLKNTHTHTHTHIYPYAALSLCWQLMWENYKNIHHLCEECTLVLGQWAARQSGPDKPVSCIYCFEGISFSLSAVGLNSLLKDNALFIAGREIAGIINSD